MALASGLLLLCYVPMMFGVLVDLVRVIGNLAGDVGQYFAVAPGIIVYACASIGWQVVRGGAGRLEGRPSRAVALQLAPVQLPKQRRPRGVKC